MPINFQFFLFCINVSQVVFRKFTIDRSNSCDRDPVLALPFWYASHGECGDTEYLYSAFTVVNGRKEVTEVTENVVRGKNPWIDTTEWDRIEQYQWRNATYEYPNITE